MNTNITRAIEFLKEQFEKSDYLSKNEKSKHYRIEHTMRVANIGKEIAIQEGSNPNLNVVSSAEY